MFLILARSRPSRFALTQCLPQTLRDKLDSPAYSGQLNFQKIQSIPRAGCQDLISVQVSVNHESRRLLPPSDRFALGPRKTA